jgi:hypothetical protein
MYVPVRRKECLTPEFLYYKNSPVYKTGFMVVQFVWKTTFTDIKFHFDPGFERKLFSSFYLNGLS